MLRAQNWKEGLPHLKLSDDARLQAAAELDVTGAAATDGRVKIGDAWWDLAQDAKGSDRNVLQARGLLVSAGREWS